MINALVQYHNSYYQCTMNHNIERWVHLKRNASHKSWTTRISPIFFMKASADVDCTTVLGSEFHSVNYFGEKTILITIGANRRSWDKHKYDDGVMSQDWISKPYLVILTWLCELRTGTLMFCVLSTTLKFRFIEWGHLEEKAPGTPGGKSGSTQPNI